MEVYLETFLEYSWSDEPQKCSQCISNVEETVLNIISIEIQNKKYNDSQQKYTLWIVFLNFDLKVNIIHFKIKNLKQDKTWCSHLNKN